MGDVARLGEDERGALVVGQLVEVAQDVAEVLAALDDGAEMLRLRLGRVLERALAPGAQDGEAAVAGDRVEPRAQLDALVRADELAVGRHERVLDGVLGLLEGADHVAAEREDAAMVAVVDGLERRLGAGTDELDEAIVGGEAEQPCGDPWAGTGGPSGGRGFHRVRIIDRMLGRQEEFPAPSA